MTGRRVASPRLSAVNRSQPDSTEFNNFFKFSVIFLLTYLSRGRHNGRQFDGRHDSLEWII